MRLMIFILFVTIPALSWAEEITCYSGGNPIYHAKDVEVYYENEVLMVKEGKNATFLFADCVVKV